MTEEEDGGQAVVDAAIYTWLTEDVRIKPNVAKKYVTQFSEHGYASMEVSTHQLMPACNGITHLCCLQALVAEPLQLQNLEEIGIKKFHRKPIFSALQVKYEDANKEASEQKQRDDASNKTGAWTESPENEVRTISADSRRYKTAEETESVFDSFVPAMFMSLPKQKALIAKQVWYASIFCVLLNPVLHMYPNLQ